MHRLVFILSLLRAVYAAAVSSIASNTLSPIVTLDFATVHGVSDGFTNAFYGIPYAQPPVGNLRLKPPLPNLPYINDINATTFGHTCYSFLSTTGPLPPWITPAQTQFLEQLTPPPPPSDEDCLTLNVIAPTNAAHKTGLPVVAFIFFGAFDFGGSYDVDGRIMVKQSIENNEPIVFVSMNHRQALGPLGFLPGKQVKDARAGNLGLQDQRQALRWIQKYIRQFGGDPNKVTLLGLSSGGISASMHLVYENESEHELFRAVWAESGAIPPLGMIDAPLPQSWFDTYAAALNCSNARDVLDCIRHAPIEAVTNLSAVSSIAWWFPHVDGVTILDFPQKMVLEGRHARVPVVTGNAEDEGTLFALTAPSNISTDEEFLNSIVRPQYNKNITNAVAQRLLELYPNDPAQGAPYGTGDDFQYTPMYKRVASFDGDINVDAVRRFLTRELSPRQDVWGYYYQRHYIDGFGSTHACEVPDMYGGGNLADLFIHFANTLNPNGAPGIVQSWPKYNNSDPVLLELSGNTTFGLINDTYRAEALDYLIQLNLEMPWPFRR